MSCSIPKHDSGRLKYICVDRACNHTQKIGCADCFLHHHVNHNRMRVEDFYQQATSKVLQLQNLKGNVLSEEDILFKDIEFDDIINPSLIGRQKTQAKYAWKSSKKHVVLYGQDDTTKQINRMAQLIQENDFTKEKYQELANIYFNPVLWIKLERIQVDEIQQIKKITQKRDKYFNKILDVADDLMRDLFVYDQIEDSGDKKQTKKKQQFQYKSRHFGTTAQKLFNQT